MKDSFHYPMLSSMQHSHYTPAKYTLSPYTPTHYAQRHYTSSQYTPRQYTPTRYTRTQCSSTRYTTSDHKPSMASVKPARTVHFPNDVVFQDHIRQGDLEQIGRFIRARKVRLDTVYLSGMAALHEAVLSGNLECVKLLVKYGADIHQRDEDGWTPLHIACSDSFPDIARFLLSQGASMEVMNESGEKPVDLIDPECKELVRLFEVGCV
ncbi:protein phosphatase 1 regulatory subunit 27 isoform X1 [Scleropages formosus]|uniref:Protein phosphatase 1 regulatory subunit 27 n=2 Tax=Scleropages formosus TaxID=113540 RepID=A0A8C9R2P1_SCLFO|nr:protein phosphatase 1 regulatory subunit 27-like isoform X1 [Scleropages formosus]